MKTTWDQKLGARQEIIIRCQNCQNKFTIISRPKLQTKRKFCSHSCATSFANKQHKGRKRSSGSIVKQKKSAKLFWDSEDGTLLKKQRSEIAKIQSNSPEFKQQFKTRMKNVNKNYEKTKTNN